MLFIANNIEACEGSPITASAVKSDTPPLAQQAALIKKTMDELERILGSPVLTGVDNLLPEDTRLGLVESLRSGLERLMIQQQVVESALAGDGADPTMETVHLLESCIAASDDVSAHVAHCRSNDGANVVLATGLLRDLATLKADVSGSCMHLNAWVTHTANQPDADAESTEEICQMQLAAISEYTKELDELVKDMVTQGASKELSADLRSSVRPSVEKTLASLKVSAARVQKVLNSIPKEDAKEAIASAVATMKALRNQQQMLEDIMDRVMVEDSDRQGAASQAILARCKNMVSSTTVTCNRLGQWLKATKGKSGVGSDKAQRMNFINNVLDEVNFTLSEQAREELMELSPTALLNEIMHAVETDMMTLAESMEKVPKFHHHLMFARIDKGTELLQEMERIALRIEEGDLGVLPRMCQHAGEVFRSIQEAQELANRWRNAKDAVIKSIQNREGRGGLGAKSNLFALMEAVMNVKSKLRKVSSAAKTHSRGRAMSGLAEDIPNELKEKLAARRAANKLAEHVQGGKQHRSESQGVSDNGGDYTPRAAQMKKMEVAHALAEGGAARRMRFNAKHEETQKNTELLLGTHHV
ncbi:hypothetical protein CYMTET_32939 [Cymbomonas tetramitiformis]|uniref:Uncharacterized protein n=1 Tax=Cymbomonas tetramitiformis TaxID=36881 RepID=A0AAE0FE18_9CHLO|nr:hypothetical protein CYMTET_32939 [Cymbomonas tetramitiformis]